MSRRLRVGLTGGIASGKSTAAQRFTELGIPVIDADESARLVVAPGQPGLVKIVNYFGSGILTDCGTLDRRGLRDLVFAEPKLRLALEAILHPLIRADMDGRSDAAIGPYIVMAIPLLVESGVRDRVDRVLVIDVAEDVQLERVMTRDGIGLEQARAILNSQARRESRLRAADDVLVNSGSVLALQCAVDHLHDRYLKLAAGTTP